MTRLRYAIIGALLFLPALLFGQSTDFLGIWEGMLEVQSVQLPIRFNLFSSGDTLSCTMDSPSQGVSGIETWVTIKENTLTVKVPNLRITYQATLIGDVLQGTFTQNGFSIPLTLDRQENPSRPRRPQTPLPPYPYETEEVSILSHDTALPAKLAGTLSYPIGYKKGVRVKQVVLLVSGSGLQDRDETVMEHRPFAVIADYLARHGIASLRYDDRGFGASTGEAEQATTKDFAADASAAIEYLHQTNQFEQIGVLGHSEGGTIAFMLAAQGKADFIISLAGSAISGKDVLLFQNRILLESQGVPEQMIKQYLSALDSLLRIASTTELRSEALVSEALTRSGAKLPLGLLINLKAVADQITPWLLFFCSYDPADDIAQTHCPVLVLNGTLDQQVDATLHLQAIEQHLPPQTPRLIEPMTGLNHLFQHATTGHVDEYYQIEETCAPEMLQRVVHWLQDL